MTSSQVGNPWKQPFPRPAWHSWTKTSRLLTKSWHSQGLKRDNRCRCPSSYQSSCLWPLRKGDRFPNSSKGEMAPNCPNAVSNCNRGRVRTISEPRLAKRTEPRPCGTQCSPGSFQRPPSPTKKQKRKGWKQEVVILASFKPCLQPWVWASRTRRKSRLCLFQNPLWEWLTFISSIEKRKREKKLEVFAGEGDEAILGDGTRPECGSQNKLNPSQDSRVIQFHDYSAKSVELWHRWESD